VAAHLKLTGRREQRLLALLSLGESLTAACRAIGVSTVTVNRHRRADPSFAELLRDARSRRASSTLEIELPDWRVVARQLEAEHPTRWALPGGASDAFDFDPLA
jgi:hypothetical protein